MKVECMVEGGGQTSEWIKCVDSSWQHDPQGTASPSNCFNELGSVDVSKLLNRLISLSQCLMNPMSIMFI